MKMITDLDLLRDYAGQKSEKAFAELVSRHLDLVYSTALRQVRSAQLAEEIAQSVFADLAKNVGRLKPDTVLAAWLYQVTRRTALNVSRGESRRLVREQIAVELADMNATSSDWTQIEPWLDDAMETLDEPDRAAILLRYFENKSLRDVGETFGVGEDAAQKRVSRAVERLREFFSKRNVTVGASGLVILISTNAVQAAPIGLALSISTAVALVGTALQTSTAIAATKTIAMTTLQKTLITAAVIAATSAGIWEARRSANLQKQIQSLRQQSAPLSRQIQEWQREHEDSARQLVALREENERLIGNSSELLKLRNEVGLLREENSRHTKSEDRNLENQKLRVASHDLKFRNPYLGKDEWQNRGVEHPNQMLETMFWAIKQGDKSKLEQLVVRKDESQSVDSLISPKSYWDKVSGVQIVDITITSDGRAMIGTIVEKQPIESKATGETYNPTSVRQWFLIETNGQWRINGSR